MEPTHLVVLRAPRVGCRHRHASGLLLLLLMQAVAAMGAVVGVLLVGRVGVEVAVGVAVAVAVAVAVGMGVGRRGWLLLDADDVIQDGALVVVREGCRNRWVCVGVVCVYAMLPL